MVSANELSTVIPVGPSYQSVASTEYSGLPKKSAAVRLICASVVCALVAVCLLGASQTSTANLTLTSTVATQPLLQSVKGIKSRVERNSQQRPAIVANSYATSSTANSEKASTYQQQAGQAVGVEARSEARNVVEVRSEESTVDERSHFTTFGAFMAAAASVAFGVAAFFTARAKQGIAQAAPLSDVKVAMQAIDTGARPIEKLRNIAIIAHVDHGKTTLVDKLLAQSGTLQRGEDQERMMDSNDQERERGITILAKNTAVDWNGYRINIVDTPGHADFGGEVERVLSMVDCVCLLVDAVDGPMPQTRFVTQKAFAQGLRPIVVVNKVDRPGSNPDRAVDRVFDLFDSLGATDEQLEFLTVYASALNGVAGMDPAELAEDMQPLFQAIIDHVPHPDVDLEAPFQMQVSSIDYDNFLGVIGIGRIKRGRCKVNQQVKVVDRDGKVRNGKIGKIMGYMGLSRIDANEAQAGDIVCITGIDALNISDTICSPDDVEPLPPLAIDEPTVSMTFAVNDGPFAGQDGKFVTSRNIKDRLDKELLYNVALRVEPGETTEKFKVSGRGELHLSVLIETMRREGYEMCVGRPEVVQKQVGNEIHEPFEEVLIDVEEQHQGGIIEELGKRRGDLTNMEVDPSGRVRLKFVIPSRGLIGFRSDFMTLTSGTGIMTSVFDHYGPVKQGEVVTRQNGVLISMASGKTTAFALGGLQDRGTLIVSPGTEIYEGMLIGVHNKNNDLSVNPLKGKQLTNMRSAGNDDNVNLTPPTVFTLEQALSFVEDDEMVEVTPNFIRLRKKGLTSADRKKK